MKKTIYPKDEIGQDHWEIDGYSFTVVKAEPFRHYINRKYGDMDSFLSLKFKDKNRIFLQWKYGFGSYETNIAIEITDRYLYHHYKNTDTDNEGLKFHIRQKIWYEEYCLDIKRDIGLLERKREVIKEVKELADKFGGEVAPF